MSARVGAVVICRRSAPLARIVDRLAAPDARIGVTLALAPELDPRSRPWLRAAAAAHEWQVVECAEPHPGAMANAALAVSDADWVFLLEAGDVLASDAASAVAAAALAAPSAAFLAGGTRLVCHGVDETVESGDPSQPAAYDPAHPALRSICWRRETVLSHGGFDARLPAAIRYELWLRLLGAGHPGAVVRAPWLTVHVDAGAFVDELNDPAAADAAREAVRRHRTVLVSHLADVLEARAARVEQLGNRHAAALARNEHARGVLAAASRPPDARPPSPASRVLPRRLTPRSRDWGYERGGPIDCVYIRRFLAQHAADIRGVVLEVQEDDYTRQFGSDVTRADVVDLDDRNPRATLITDLRSAPNLSADTYDCIILTQTAHVIDDMPAVIAQCWRLLRPGGVLLATFPCASRICLEYGRDGDFWRLTPDGARRLMRDAFGDAVSIEAFGNIMATTAFLLGLSPVEVREEELAFRDPYNPTLVGVRAVKTSAREGAGAPVVLPAREDAGLVLLYHRVAADGPDPHGIAMPPEAFEAQMAWLNARCAVLPLAELADGAAARRLPPRAVAITLDDGYVDTLERAWPVLEAYGLPATCFVMTEGLDDVHVFWWDELAALLLGDGERPDRLEIALPDRTWRFDTASRGERLLAHGILYDAIVREPVPVRERVLEQLRRWAPRVHPGAACRRMSGAELRTASARGLAIGAHTVRHPQLPRLDAAAKRDEIAGSARELERLTGGPVRHFAYPFGAVDAESAAAARDAGMTLALTCEPRRLRSTDDRMKLPRLEVRDSRFDRFQARIEEALAS
ncbi:MAG TPA: polysaccharide deacetylase family protein [Vicinamibacterales bacterium]